MRCISDCIKRHYLLAFLVLAIGSLFYSLSMTTALRNYPKVCLGVLCTLAGVAIILIVWMTILFVQTVLLLALGKGWREEIIATDQVKKYQVEPGVLLPQREFKARVWRGFAVKPVIVEVL